MSIMHFMVYSLGILIVIMNAEFIVTVYLFVLEMRLIAFSVACVGNIAQFSLPT